MAKLAANSFNSGPSDSVELVDVYNTTDSGTRNKLTSLISSFGQGLESMLGTSNKNLNQVGSDYSRNAINLDQAKDRIQRALSGSRGDIQYLAEGAQKAIYTELTGTDQGTNYIRKTSQLYDQVQVLTGQGTYLMRDNNYTNVNSVLRFVSDITGSGVFEALDLGAEGALITGAIKTMSAWGIPELMTEMLKDRDSGFKHTVVSRSAAQIAASGDADTVEAMIGSTSAATLLAECPDFPQQFISRYTLKPGKTTTDYPTLLAQLVRIMDQLKYDWFWIPRGSDQAWNLDVIAHASNDAQILLKSSDTYKAAVMIAPNYGPQSMVSVAKTLYPNLVL